MSLFNGLDTEKLADAVEGVKKNWELGRTVWKASTTWKGGFRVSTFAREFSTAVDEPEPLCGTNTAPNPADMVLEAYGACLTIGYVMNATIRGIKIEELKIDVEGEIDLPGFLGLEPPANLNMDKLPGFKAVTANAQVKANADEKALQNLFKHVVSTSPIGITLSRPVKVSTNLKVV